MPFIFARHFFRHNNFSRIDWYAPPSALVWFSTDGAGLGRKLTSWHLLECNLILECAGRADNVYDRVDWQDGMGWDGMELCDDGTDRGRVDECKVRHSKAE